MCRKKGTWHTDGESIAAAIRAQHNAALLRCAASERKKRTPLKWQMMYDAAMAEKRAAAMNLKEAA